MPRFCPNKNASLGSKVKNNSDATIIDFKSSLTLHLWSNWHSHMLSYENPLSSRNRILYEVFICKSPVVVSLTGFTVLLEKHFDQPCQKTAMELVGDFLTRCWLPIAIYLKRSYLFFSSIKSVLDVDAITVGNILIPKPMQCFYRLLLSRSVTMRWDYTYSFRFQIKCPVD